MSKRKIGFIGAGTLATALAKGLSRRGHAIIGIASRSMDSAHALAARIPGCQAFSSAHALAHEVDLVFVTTPDDVISNVAAQVTWRPGQWVVHCSGAESIEALRPAVAQGAIPGAFHPLQSFAAPGDSIQRFRGIVIALEGEGELLEYLKRLSRALGATGVVLNPQDKALYHASAAMASNYLVTLMAMASSLWERFGYGSDQGIRALAPLMRGTIQNIETLGIPACLTGPIARGDEGTIQQHLKALPDELAGAYAQMGLQTIPIALAKGGINPQKANSLKNIFSLVMEKQSHVLAG